MRAPYYQRAGITLYHGDCREVLPGLHADVLITDPPYGMSFASNWTGVERPIANDATTEVRDFVLAWWGDKPAAVFGTPKVERPKTPHQVLVWDKSQGVGPGMGDLGSAFGYSHEEIYIIGKWPKRGPRRGSVLSTHCAMGNPNGLVATTGHPTPKPLELMAVLLSAAPEGTILDPFAGSGSTLVAALRMQRPAIGIELEEKYCEIAAKRLDRELAQGDLFIRRDEK